MFQALGHAAEGLTALVAGKDNIRVFMVKALVPFDWGPVSPFILICRH